MADVSQLFGAIILLDFFRLSRFDVASLIRGIVYSVRRNGPSIKHVKNSNRCLPKAKKVFRKYAMFPSSIISYKI